MTTDDTTIHDTTLHDTTSNDTTSNQTTNGSRPPTTELGAGWHADPEGRATYRYHDGSAWTRHVSNGSTAYVEGGAEDRPMQVAASPSPGTAVPTTRTPGRLLAAGVMTIVEAALVGIGGLFVANVATSDVGSVADEASGGALSSFMFVMFAIAAGFAVIGIGACRGRHWGRISAIVVHGIFGALSVLALLSSVSSDNGDGPGGLVLLTAWFATIVFLAYSGVPGNADDGADAAPAVTGGRSRN